MNRCPNPHPQDVAGLHRPCHTKFDQSKQYFKSPAARKITTALSRIVPTAGDNENDVTSKLLAPEWDEIEQSTHKRRTPINYRRHTSQKHKDTVRTDTSRNVSKAPPIDHLLVSRLEALGLVTSGVAHDFRSITQAMLAGAHMIKHALARGDAKRARELADMMDQAASRGSDLSSRLLDLVRRPNARPTEPCGTNPARAVADAALLLRSALAPSHSLHVHMADSLPARVGANQVDLEGAVINLVMNACDAMRKGGEICIEADEDRDPPGLPAGLYVRIRVRDTGIGMSRSTVKRAGEPFFTTKGEGRGTGLGLMSAKRVASDAGGRLAIESKRGHGTTVTLWLLGM